MRKFFPLAAAAILGGGLVLSQSMPTGAASTPVKKVAMQDVAGQTQGTFAFSPKKITIKAGTKVVWSNTSSQPHTVTSSTKNSSGKPSFDSGSSFDKFIQPGKTWSHTFKKAGTFNYVCIIHPGMKGKIVVQK